MSQLQVVPFTANVTSKYAMASDPSSLQASAQALIDLLTTAGRVVALDLAGAGDGHTFVVQADSLIGGTPAVGLKVFCYEANNSGTLNQAYSDAQAAAIAANPGLDLVDHLVAGASKDQRFMGMFLLAPPGTYPTAPGAGSLAAGFGFPIGAANTPLAIGAGQNFAAAIAAAPVAVALDAASSALFAIGTGADAGKLKYIGPAPITVEVTLDVVMSDGAPPNNVLLSLLKGGVAQATTRQTTAAATQAAVSLTALLSLVSGDLLDGSSDTAINLVKYHLTVASV